MVGKRLDFKLVVPVAQVHTRKDLIVGLGGEDVVAGGVRRQDLQQLIWRHRGRGPPPPEHAAAH